MTAPKEIVELVARFEQHRAAYLAGKYNETQLRREFLDPFFTALGWDVENRSGYAEAYKDVVHEDQVKVGVMTKAPDYSFRIGGTRKFFVEAKKPSVNIKEDQAPAFQLRRYAWSAKLSLGILTDFEEFAVYDCRIRPGRNDKAGVGRLLYLTHRDYADKWEEIAAIFSRDAVLKGSFDKYATRKTRTRGTAEVDAAFLEDIEGWRDQLARNLASRNPALTQRDLNFAVQRTIDRLIFLRICEDRGIEREGRLLGITNGAGIYPRLLDLYRQADERYNSGLFHFREEKGRAEGVDRLTPSLLIDDKVLKDIVARLYPPESPYEFSVLPADILGQVYEQFLGKVIRLTPGHQAKVEEKPEVKKAGGVYYTPTFIVDYIVGNTVDRLLEGKTAAEAAKVRIVDPACGSGSFLIVAYQHLLDWHRDLYVANGPEKAAKGKHPPLYQAMGGEWRLTTGERKRILLNNIYGVDIDSQAVEVTKLSLLLKVLEGETEQTLKSQFDLFRQRALPDLGANIQCGNSLIGPDFEHFHQMSLLGEKELFRVNTFDWKKAFPPVFTGVDSGFDAVIGNPPYIRIQALKEWAPLEVEFYKERYATARKGNYDIYVAFVEKGLGLLNRAGRLGFILPHKFFNAQYGEPLRDLISKGKHLAEVIHFGDKQVFVGATTYTCLMFLNKAGSDACRVVKVEDLDAWKARQIVSPMGSDSCSDAPEGNIEAESIGAAEWYFSVGKHTGLIEKIVRESQPLGSIAEIFVGLQTSADDVFILDHVCEADGELLLKSKALGMECRIEKQMVYPLVSGTDVRRYQPLPARQYILFPYQVEDGDVSLITLGGMSKQFPDSHAYLVKNKKRLEDREKGRMKGNKWHGYVYLKNMSKQSLVKLCVPRLVTRLCASYDRGGDYFLDNVDVGGITLNPGGRDLGYPYLLGLINSRLLGWFFPHISAPFRGGFWSANRQFLSRLPIRIIDFSDKADKARHDRMVALVEQMLDLHKRRAAANTDHERNVLTRQIDATDRLIDRLVYELYDLTDEEIALVEEGSKPHEKTQTAIEGSSEPE